MPDHEIYMQRCLELAALGIGTVSPNPMVGAVIVLDGQIIGEGYHRQYGQAHAEVNAVNAVLSKYQNAEELLQNSTIYVSLEPCAHYGKTPPCADLIIKHRIPNVIVGCRDPFDQVNGKVGEDDYYPFGLNAHWQQNGAGNNYLYNKFFKNSIHIKLLLKIVFFKI